MALFIVVEGISDQIFLERLLADELASVEGEIRVGQGKSSADSLARTLLATRGKPVALVLDADSTDPGLVSEQLQYYRSAFRRAAALEGRFHICLLEPRLEIVAFGDPAGLAEALQKDEISELDLTEARYAPELVLRRLLGEVDSHPLEYLSQRLSEATVERLKSHPAVADLIAFIHRVRDDQAAA